MKHDEIIKNHGAKSNSSNPSVYVGTYKKYNCGSLFGAWLDLTTFADFEEFIDVCKELHKDEKHPELDFQDFENVPKGKQDFSGIEDIINLYNEEDDNTIKIVLEYWQEINADTTVDEINDSLVFSGDFSEFADEIADEMLTECPENIRYYFNYQKFYDDLSLDYNITTNYVFSA